MFNLTGSEIVVILLLALVVLGPEKLPDAIRRFGRTYAELKKMGTGFQQEFRSVVDEPMREMRETADLIRQSADFTSPDESSEKPHSPGGPADQRLDDELDDDDLDEDEVGLDDDDDLDDDDLDDEVGRSDAERPAEPSDAAADDGGGERGDGGAPGPRRGPTFDSAAPRRAVSTPPTTAPPPFSSSSALSGERPPTPEAPVGDDEQRSA